MYTPYVALNPRTSLLPDQWLGLEDTGAATVTFNLCRCTLDLGMLPIRLHHGDSPMP